MIGGGRWWKTASSGGLEVDLKRSGMPFQFISPKGVKLTELMSLNCVTSHIQKINDIETVPKYHGDRGNSRS